MANPEQPDPRSEPKSKDVRAAEKKDRANKRIRQNRVEAAKDVVKAYKEHKERKENLHRKLVLAEQSGDTDEKIKLSQKWVEMKNEEAALATEVQRELPEVGQMLANDLARLKDPRHSVDLNNERRIAQDMKNHGAASPDTMNGAVMEAAGMLLEDKVDNLREIREQERANPRPVRPPEIRQNSGSNVTFQEAKEELEMAKVRQTMSPEDSEARQTIIQMNRRMEEIAGSDLGVRQDRQEVERIKNSRDKPFVVLAQMERLLADRAQEEEVGRALHEENAGVRAFDLQQQRNRYFEDVVTKTPEFREYDLGLMKFSGQRADLMQRYNNGQISRDEMFGQQRVIRGQEQEAQANMARQMMATHPELGGRLGMYERPPSKDDPEKQLLWVLSRLRTLEGTSPKFLAYSLAFGELLNGVGDLTTELKNFVSGWRNTYEFGIVFETSGSSTEVLQQAGGIDNEFFTFGIGLTDSDGKLTKEAKMIQKGFALFEKYGHQFADSNDEDRTKIKMNIAGDIAKELGGPEGTIDKTYGDIYMRMAYRYWKVLGREAKFDYVRIEDKEGKFGPKGANYVVSELGDKLVGSKYWQKRYDSYSQTPIRFWLRRLLSPVVNDSEGNLMAGFDGRMRDKYGNFIDKDGVIVKLKPGGKLPDGARYNPNGQIAYDERAKIEFTDRLVGDKVKRVLKKAQGIRQEKNFEWIPTRLDAMNFGVTDYVTQFALEGDDQKKAEFGVITEEMLDKINWADKGIKYGVIADMWNKAHNSREAVIGPEGILQNPNVNLPGILALNKVWQHNDDRADTQNVEIIRQEILAHKNNAFLGIVPRQIIWKEVVNKDGTKSKFKRPIIPMSEAQETGIPSKAMGRWEIEMMINDAVGAGYISPEKGEELKRELLKFLGLPGIGIIRGAGIAFEVVTNPGNIFGFFWAMFTKFLQLGLPKELGLAK